MANFKKAHINFTELPKVYNFIPNVILTAPVHEVEKEYVKDYFVAGEYNFIPNVILTAPVNESEKPYTSEFYANAENANFETAEHFNADFNNAQSVVAINEGGYQQRSNDAGNWTGGKVNSGNLIGTNWGVSAPVLSQYLGRTATINDMQALSYSDAVNILKQNYWDKIEGDKILSDSVATSIYDGAINGGVAGIKKIVAPLLPSGTYSVTEINAADPKILFAQIKQARQDFYTSLGGSNLTGWLNRLNKLTFTDAVQSVKQGITNVSNAVLGTKATAAIKQNSKLALAVIIGASLFVGLVIVAIASKKSTVSAPATT